MSDLCLVQLCYLQRTGNELRCEDCLAYSPGDCSERVDANYTVRAEND